VRIKGAGLTGLLLLSARLAQAHHLDATNTEVSFYIEHLGVHWFSVDFHELSGEFALDPDGHGGQLTVAVNTASIDSRSPYWNERLRSPQWLDTLRYPQMLFRSQTISFEGAHAVVNGQLTLHGMTHPLSLSVTEIDCPQSAGGLRARCRFVGRASLKRSDYGIEHGFWAGGDTVRIVVRGI
jgi:polyisoprenoid-binding protein YceI